MRWYPKHCCQVLPLQYVEPGVIKLQHSEGELHLCFSLDLRAGLFREGVKVLKNLTERKARCGFSNDALRCGVKSITGHHKAVIWSAPSQCQETQRCVPSLPGAPLAAGVGQRGQYLLAPDSHPPVMLFSICDQVPKQCQGS